MIHMSDSVGALGIGGRTLNVLACAGVQTVGQLLDCSDEDIQQMEHCMALDYNRIHAALQTHGLTLSKISRKTPV